MVGIMISRNDAETLIRIIHVARKASQWKEQKEGKFFASELLYKKFDELEDTLNAKL